MRIIDWSSDVCSSDLADPLGVEGGERPTAHLRHEVERLAKPFSDVAEINAQPVGNDLERCRDHIACAHRRILELLDLLGGEPKAADHRVRIDTGGHLPADSPKPTYAPRPHPNH